jgi:hypothetical protein
MAMRSPIVAIVSILTLVPASGAFAQNDTQNDQKRSQPSFSQTQVEQEHPEWFSEPGAYRPCQANVEFRGGHSTCLNGGSPP